jgi:cyanophycin synthetase
LVIDNKLVAAAKRVPAHVIEMATIQELIATENLDPKEAMVMKMCNQIDVNRDTEDLLKKLNYSRNYSRKVTKSKLI